jgi:hypothetical protein
MTHKIQIDDEIRNATLAESAVIDAQREELKTHVAALEAAAAAKVSARTKLAALGLTDAEIAALLGA